MIETVVIPCVTLHHNKGCFYFFVGCGYSMDKFLNGANTNFISQVERMWNGVGVVS